ncbi:hypothetical protein Tco_0960979 [Tanacetum coccineum]
MTESPFVDSGFAIPVFSPRDDLIACLNKAMAFLTAVASSREDKGKIILVILIRAMLLVQGEILQVDRQELLNVTTAKTEDLDTYDSDCDDLSTAQAVLMANISNYGSDVISEVPNSKTYLNDMDNQSVHALQDFEQSPVMDFTDNEISNEMINHVNNWEKANKEQNNESITAELERYKERVKTFEQRLNIDLSSPQRIKPTLYDGAVISKTHVAMPMIDDEETLILEEESRSKMFEKAKDPEVIAKKISHKPIDYEKLNSLIKDFETRFSPQQELSAEQAFWFHTFNPTIEPSYSPPVIVDVPSELPKVSLVNASLKKLKFHLTQFDSVVKKRKTPSALEEGKWGCYETVMNSMSLNYDSVNVKMQKCEFCEKCLNLDAELSKSKQAYNALLKNHSQLEKHCISLEVSMQLKQEVFQNDESCVSQNAVEIQEYFEINDLKARYKTKTRPFLS